MECFFGVWYHDVQKAGGRKIDLALQTVRPTVSNPTHLKLVPILSGGDDTTVVCRGVDAFAFVGQYLAAFEHHTIEHPEVGRRLAKVGEAPVPLTSCAGVVWTKASYPLSLAMDLANDLCREAKAAVAAADEPLSAWEFHDVHDSVAVSWHSVLDDLTTDVNDGGTALLCHRPVYVEGSHPRWSELGSDTAIRIRTHAQLHRRVNACVGAHNRSSTLTTAQLYQLREALFLGADVADQQLRLVEERCGVQPDLRAEGDSLFFGQQIRTTPLLDAMTIARNLI